MTMTTEKLAELKRLAEKATPGEWIVSNRIEDPMNGVTMISFVSPANDTSPEAIVCETLGGEHDDEANAAFIAAANPHTILSLIALAERALQPQTPMDLTVYTLERLRGAMTRFGISCGEGGMEHFSVKFESHLLEFIRAATDNLDKLRQAYSDLEASKRALQPEEGQGLPELPKPFQTVYDDIDHEEVPCYSPVQMHAYARAYAFQLALPAGQDAVRQHKDPDPSHPQYVAGFKEGHKAGRARALPAGPVPELEVWYGSMPESNGKSNFTAILRRKGASIFDTDGFTIARSEYPERVRYDADCVRFLIGEIDNEPFILDYNGDKHSGYVEPASPAGPVPENVRQAGPVPENKHDWPEDGPHENGKYLSRCHQCYVFFTGHKRRVTCKVCASPAVAQPVCQTCCDQGDVYVVKHEGELPSHDLAPCPDCIKTVAQPVADERARFEAWASEPFRADKLPLEMHPNGAYKDTRSYLIWYGWKSRAALGQPAEEARPADCTRDPQCCPQNEGHGCDCSKKQEGGA